MGSTEQHILGIRHALTEEIAALSQMPRTTILSNGHRVALHGDIAIYRFEIPENYSFTPSCSVRCTVGTTVRFSFTATVADVQSQFLYLLFPCNAGETVPELDCKWNPSERIDQLNSFWTSFTPNAVVNSLLERKFSENALPAEKEPIFPSTFTPSQQQAIKQSMNRKISFVIGERKRGKTGVAASLVLNSLREGKRVLYLSGSSGSLHGLLKEIAEVNPTAAEESMTVLNEGLTLRSDHSLEFYPALHALDDETRNGLTKLFSIINAEYEYNRIQHLQEKMSEKQQQINEATEEWQSIKEELNRVHNASMIERMRIGKKTVEELQNSLREKNALMERLKQHLTVITKELFKKETAIPVSLREKKMFERFTSTVFPPANTASMYTQILTRPCLATTVYNAVALPANVLSSFDIVCIDDAHSLSLAQFFLFASFAKVRCFILADVTEQPPQSTSQFDAARTWLQKNYFAYYQNEDSEYYRFMINLLPYDVVSELVLPEVVTNIFEACLLAALEDSPIPPGSKGRIFFLNTEDQHATSPQYIGKKKILPFNEANAKRVADCVKHALLNGTTTVSDILIVAPPSGQTMYLREYLRAHQLCDVEIAPLGSIRLCSKRAVVFDLTVAGIDFTLRTLDDRKTGLVHVADTFNTLFSTVTDDLYIVGDLIHFRTKYKGRFITTLLEKIITIKENEAAILSAARRFDDLATEIRNRVIASAKEEKSLPEYKSKLDQSRPSSLDTSKSGPTNTVAAADKKLKSDVRLACLRVLARREMINLIAQYLGAFPLYKTTVETQKFSKVLPEYDCENENDFKLVMDMWNLLIYETSDAQKVEHPLFLKAKVDSKVPIDLQQIYSFYHSDLEMVVEEGKHRLAQSIQRIFNDCIGKKPVTPVDWMNAYIVFLNRMSKYLDTIINQIRA
ncbi:MAG: hypothetical protein WCX28_02715 [Bacteriovoracaceae bacterium]|nr:hypothetical protein [Bacteroidota bacterium]